MSKEDLKGFEKYAVKAFKSAFKDFPEGELIADEGQERPDVLVVAAHRRDCCFATVALRNSGRRKGFAPFASLQH
jgi:hypothetical protein